jgi:hypothetical protein
VEEVYTVDIDVTLRSIARKLEEVMKRKLTAVAKIQVDPTIESSEIVIDGKVYRMCFDLGALAEAEDRLIARGWNINILDAFPRLNLSSVRTMFAVSLHKFHPEIAYEDALALLTLPYVYKAGVAIKDAWEKSLSKQDKDVKTNPTVPGL